jgi:hypothetical protein
MKGFLIKVLVWNIISFTWKGFKQNDLGGTFLTCNGGLIYNGSKSSGFQRSLLLLTLFNCGLRLNVYETFI